MPYTFTQHANCQYCNGPMRLTGIRIWRLSICWGNSHHQHAAFHGYQPFGLGPYLLLRWGTPSTNEREKQP